MASKKMGSAKLLAALYDGGVFTPLFEVSGGAVVSAHGTVGGQGVYAVCQNGQALSAADIGVCRKTLRLAGDTGCPVVTFYNSPAVEIEDGLASMAAVKNFAKASAKVSGVVPQIAVVTGVCGASNALAAASADVCIMTKDAELFLTPPFLSAAAGEKMEGAGSIESAIKAGVVSVSASDELDAVAKAAKILALLPANNLSETQEFKASVPGDIFPTKDYTGIAAIKALCDVGSEMELFSGFGDGIITALCTVNGNVTGIAAANGPGTKVGRLCAARAARFARLCDAYSIPLVTVLNTGGFVVSSESDESGMIREASRLAATYGDASCAKVAILAGRTIGAVYTAFGNADLTVALNTSVTAPVEPSAAVSVICKDEISASAKPIKEATADAVKLYEAKAASAEALYRAGLANYVVEQNAVRAAVVNALDILMTKRAQRLPKKHGNMAL